MRPIKNEPAIAPRLASWRICVSTYRALVFFADRTRRVNRTLVFDQAVSNLCPIGSQEYRTAAAELRARLANLRTTLAFLPLECNTRLCRDRIKQLKDELDGLQLRAMKELPSLASCGAAVVIPAPPTGDVPAQSVPLAMVHHVEGDHADHPGD